MHRSRETLRKSELPFNGGIGVTDLRVTKPGVGPIESASSRGLVLDNKKKCDPQEEYDGGDRGERKGGGKIMIDKEEPWKTEMRKVKMKVKVSKLKPMDEDPMDAD